MKIVVVGSNEIYSIENIYVRYLQKLGNEVFHFPAQSIFYQYYQDSFFHKLFFRLGISTIYGKINKEFKEIVSKTKPDIIWVFKGMEIFPASLKWAKKQNCKLVNFNTDNPFLFSGKGSGNKNITESIGLYDLHFTYNLEVKKILEQRFREPVAYLPFGFDAPVNVYEECIAQEEKLKACFLGNPDADRALFIRQLADKGIQIDVYGHSWDQFINHPGVVIYEPVYGIGFWKTLWRYRVQINMMRVHNLDAHNMRSFEIPGIGGIQVAPDTVEHRQLFENGSTIFLYRDADSCATVIRELLNLNKEQSGSIRLRARNWSMEKGYNYEGRTSQVIEVLEHHFSHRNLASTNLIV